MDMLRSVIVLSAVVVFTIVIATQQFAVQEGKALWAACGSSLAARLTDEACISYLYGK